MVRRGALPHLWATSKLATVDPAAGGSAEGTMLDAVDSEQVYNEKRAYLVSRFVVYLAVILFSMTDS